MAGAVRKRWGKKQEFLLLLMQLLLSDVKIMSFIAFLNKVFSPAQDMAYVKHLHLGN